MAAAPKQLTAEMAKVTAKVTPGQNSAWPVLLRFFALARRLSTGVGSGFLAKNCRAQPAAPPLCSACRWPARMARPAALMP